MDNHQSRYLYFGRSWDFMRKSVLLKPCKTCDIRFYNQFKTRKKPKYIVNQKRLSDHKDYECKSIQKAFKLKTVKNLTPYDCWTMLVDGYLICDDAYLHFLPRLFEHVLEDPINEDLLSSRLKGLDKRNLSSDETAIIEKIKIVAAEIEEYWDMLGAKNY